jgi:hypothetical protein
MVGEDREMPFETDGDVVSRLAQLAFLWFPKLAVDHEHMNRYNYRTVKEKVQMLPTFCPDCHNLRGVYVRVLRNTQIWTLSHPDVRGWTVLGLRFSGRRQHGFSLTSWCRNT